MTFRLTLPAEHEEPKTSSETQSESFVDFCGQVESKCDQWWLQGERNQYNRSTLVVGLRLWSHSPLFTNGSTIYGMERYQVWYTTRDKIRSARSIMEYLRTLLSLSHHDNTGSFYLGSDPHWRDSEASSIYRLRPKLGTTRPNSIQTGSEIPERCRRGWRGLQCRVQRPQAPKICGYAFRTKEKDLKSPVQVPISFYFLESKWL